MLRAQQDRLRDIKARPHVTSGRLPASHKPATLACPGAGFGPGASASRARIGHGVPSGAVGDAAADLNNFSNSR